MCFLFKDIVEVRRKLFENREKGCKYVASDCDPDKLELETRIKIAEYLKQRQVKEV